MSAHKATRSRTRSRTSTRRRRRKVRAPRARVPLWGGLGAVAVVGVAGLARETNLSAVTLLRIPRTRQDIVTAAENAPHLTRIVIGGPDANELAAAAQQQRLAAFGDLKPDDWVVDTPGEIDGIIDAARRT